MFRTGTCPLWKIVKTKIHVFLQQDIFPKCISGYNTDNCVKIKSLLISRSKTTYWCHSLYFPIPYLIQLDLDHQHNPCWVWSLQDQWNHLRTALLPTEWMTNILFMLRLSTEFTLYQKHFTIFTCVRPLSVSFLCEKEPPPPRSTLWDNTGDMVAASRYLLQCSNLGKCTLFLYFPYCTSYNPTTR